MTVICVNIWRLSLCILLGLITSGLLDTMCYSNLIQLTNNVAITTGYKPKAAAAAQAIYRPVIRDRLAYTSTELVRIGDNIQHDRRYHILDSAACVNIRELRLNKRRKRGKRAGQQRKQKQQLASDRKEGKVNHNNLIQIQTTELPSQHENKVKLLTINARSVKNKDELIKNHLIDDNVDICVISETWLKDSDQAWTEGCELNKDGYKMQTANRLNRTGGGLACVYNDKYKVEQKIHGTKRSFEYALWHVKLTDADSLNVLGIYHPPPSDKNPPNSVFIDEIAKFMADEIMHLESLVILGDFNIRVNDTDDHDVTAFSDTFYALGLDQHVNFDTHVHGNTVDLVFTENLSKIKITECTQGPFLSDHCAISCITSITKEEIKRSKISYRKLKNVSAEDLINDMDIQNIMTADGDLEELVTMFNNEAQKAMDTHAPIKEKTITQRPKKPWYSDEIRVQKRVFRNRERVWKKYRTPETWTALKAERHKYKKMLVKSKRETICDKVQGL